MSTRKACQVIPCQVTKHLAPNHLALIPCQVSNHLAPNHLAPDHLAPNRVRGSGFSRDSQPLAASAIRRPNRSYRAISYAKYLWVIALASSFALAACAVLARELRVGFENRDATLFHEQGVVHQIDYGAQTALIGGLNYRFAPDARVQVNDTFGAWSMLLPSMKVDFLYYEHSPSQRTIVELHELPPELQIEGH